MEQGVGKKLALTKIKKFMFTLRTHQFVTDLLNTVDQVIGHFVQTGYQNFVANNQGTLTLMMTFYIMWLGYRFTMRTLEMDINTIAKHLVLLLIVYGLLTHWHIFWLFFYNIFTNEPSLIIKTMIDANGNINLQGNSTANALNSVFSQGINAAQSILQQANFQNLMMFIYAGLVFTVSCMSCLFALTLLIYAKMALAIMLFLAPLFISFLLWQNTRRLFENWLQALINFSLIPIVTCGILMLTLTVAQSTLPGLINQTKQGMTQLSGILPYVGISIISGLLLKQVLPLCAALSSGLALESMGSAIPIVRNALKYSGISSLKNTSNKSNFITRRSKNSAPSAEQLKAEKTRPY